MDNLTIFYKGLVGSRLYGCERPDSDIDYFIIVNKRPQMAHRVTTPEGDVVDYFWELPYEFMHSLFDDCPLTFWQVNVLERLFSKDTEEFITPLEKWLCQNRLTIIHTNRIYFGQSLLWRANMIGASDSHLYTHPPKIMAKSLMNVYTYINFASLDKFTFGSFTNEQAQILKDIRENKYTNFEVMQFLREALKESQQYDDFWSVPKDEEEQKRLNEEMRLLIEGLIGEEPSECQD